MAVVACGARSPVDPFDLLTSAGGAPPRGGSSPTGGSSTGAFGGVSGTGGTSFGGSTSGRGGVAGTAGVGGLGGMHPVGGTGGTTGGGESGHGGESGSGGESGEGGSGGEGGAEPVATDLALGAFHTCVRFDDGSLRCWGSDGYIGSGDHRTIGDDETPDVLPDVDIGNGVTRIAAGWYQTCAVLERNRVRCFGAGASGLLGYANTSSIGDDESPASAGNVDVGGPAVDVAAGPNHTCAVIDDGSVRCWGKNADFELGHPGPIIGDDESPASIAPVDVGGFVVQVGAGLGHTCALLRDGAVRCWGTGTGGRLGYGNQVTIGDDETPASAGDVPVGGRAIQIAVGAVHTCALLVGGRVRCWGSGIYGQLGYGNTFAVGDDETPESVGNVEVGGSVRALAAGDYATCALLQSGHVRCWGSGQLGELGYGNTSDVGDDETPASVGDIELGGRRAVRIDVGFLHACAVFAGGGVRCWGRGVTGALGYGNLLDVGDDETPADVGDVEVR